MAEKDRLINEKDELVASKDRLWREMHQMLQEQQKQIEGTSPGHTLKTRYKTNALEVQQLRKENSRLKRRNKDLERALRNALETEEGSERDEMKADGNSSEIDTKCGFRPSMCYWLTLTASGSKAPMRSTYSAALETMIQTIVSTSLLQHH